MKKGELVRDSTVRKFRTVQIEDRIKKYQAKTLSSAEKDFLRSIKLLEKIQK